MQTVDVNAQPTLAWEYKVRSVPTYVYVVNGQEVRRRTGSLPVSTLRQLYRKPLF